MILQLLERQHVFNYQEEENTEQENMNGQGYTIVYTEPFSGYDEPPTIDVTDDDGDIVDDPIFMNKLKDLIMQQIYKPINNN